MLLLPARRSLGKAASYCTNRKEYRDMARKVRAIMLAGNTATGSTRYNSGVDYHRRRRL